uniref:SKP1-like protein n=1 Tax=Arundo donax TaxID=35708 RepID=A0A0A9ADB6_ARUDO
MAAEGGAVPEEVTLVTSDGQEFQVAEQDAVVSPTIRQMIEDGLGNRRFTLPNVTSQDIPKVIAFAQKLVESRAAAAGDGPYADHEADIAWAKDLVQVDPTSLTRLILAAHYLEMDDLLHFACERAAEVMAGRTADEIQKMFSLKCVVTPAEQAEIQKKNEWAFE